LEEGGLVSTVRGRGTCVTRAEELRRGTPAEARQRVVGRLTTALADARLAGLDRTAVERIVERLVIEFWGHTQVTEE
jgi:hypothetical protein